mmetsp:Transcript_8196/g.24424  ORF Transcript_8196/g.24424 Transcript_8196/m.24424 type:complete len:263 (+) Transcript_8196:1512-2300(+)
MLDGGHGQARLQLVHAHRAISLRPPGRPGHLAQRCHLRLQLRKLVLVQLLLSGTQPLHAGQHAAVPLRVGGRCAALILAAAACAAAVGSQGRGGSVAVSLGHLQQHLQLLHPPLRLLRRRLGLLQLSFQGLAGLRGFPLLLLRRLLQLLYHAQAHVQLFLQRRRLVAGGTVLLGHGGLHGLQLLAHVLQVRHVRHLALSLLVKAVDDGLRLLQLLLQVRDLLRIRAQALLQVLHHLRLVGVALALGGKLGAQLVGGGGLGLR